MSSDPILDEVYTAKETLTANCGGDLHALAESFRHSPTRTPIKRPARLIQTAHARLRKLTDPGDEIREVRKVKEKIAAENDCEIHKIGEAVRKFALEKPLPPSTTRKLA